MIRTELRPARKASSRYFSSRSRASSLVRPMICSSGETPLLPGVETPPPRGPLVPDRCFFWGGTGEGARASPPCPPPSAPPPPCPRPPPRLHGGDLAVEVQHLARHSQMRDLHAVARRGHP